MKLKRTVHQVFAIAKTDFLGIARNKTAIFFTLLFPLFFLIIIGFTFGTQGGESSRIHVGTVNHDGDMIVVNDIASQNGTVGDEFVQRLKDANFTVYEYSMYGDKDTNGTAAYDLSRGQIKVAVVVPANFTETLSFQYTDSLGMPIPTKARLDLYTDPSDPTGSLIVQQSVLGFISVFIDQYQGIVISQITDAQMRDYAKVLADPITVSTSEADVSGRQLRWIDYMVPGTLGLVLLWSGLNHASVAIAGERTKGTFQRMIIAPVSPITVLVGKFISCLAIVYLSAVIMLASGILLFQVNLYWNIPAIALSVFLGALSAIGLGLIISSVAKNEEAASSITVVISIPLQFFIGAFFPLSIMPEPAQIFGEALPFTKLVNAMQGIMTKNLLFEAVMPEVIYMTISGLILFTLGIIAYRLSLRRL